MRKLLIKKSEAKKNEEHGVSIFSEYNLPFNNLSVGVSEINGQYPQSGSDVDVEIEQVWYVERGRGKVWIQDIEYVIAEGDMMLIPKGENYRIFGEGLKIITSSSPPWFASQHKHLD